MTTALAVPTSWAPAERESAIQRLRDVRARIASADAETAQEAIVWAAALASAAQLKQAEDVIADAVETRVRAERRLAQLVLADDTLADQVGIVVDTDLAKIPSRLFEKTLSEMLAEGKLCRAHTVVKRAERSSLKQVEPDVWAAWNGVHYVRAHRGGLKRCGDLDVARLQLDYERGVGKRWTLDMRLLNLKADYTDVRKLSQRLNRHGAVFAGEERAMLAKAEHMAMEIAAILDRVCIAAALKDAA